jgi:Flp pilus assembly protein TadD
VIFARTPDEAGINNDLGYLYADQGKNLEKAEAMIRKAVAEEPDNYAYLDSLGWVLFKRGKFQEARIPLERAQSDPRQDATIPDHLGDVYFQLQELPKARAAWERALKIANESKPPDKKLGEIKKKLQSLQSFTPSPKPKTGDSP